MSCSAIRSQADQDVFLAKKNGKPMSASSGLEIQQRKKKHGGGSRVKMMGILAAEAKAVAKVKSMLAAEVAMESQAVEYADQVAAEADSADRTLGGAESAPEGQDHDASLQYTPELAHAAQVYDLGGAAVAEWAAKAARAEAQAQVSPFPQKARKPGDAHHYSMPASIYELELRLHGLRTAKQAVVMAHSWKLALKLGHQVTDLENMEKNPKENIEKNPQENMEKIPQEQEMACVSDGDAMRVQSMQQQIDVMEQSMKDQIEKMRNLQQQIDSVKLTPNVSARGMRSASSPSDMPDTQQLKMFSAKQRLSQEDALSLYRLGHVVGALLDRHQIVWWAAGGTLLGAVRNKGIIPHDDDIDYNILNDQSKVLLSRTFINELTKNGLTLHRVEEGFWQISPLHQKGNAPLHVDIFAMWQTFSACCQKNVICYPNQWWHKHTFPTSLCSSNSSSKLPDQNRQISCPLLRRWPFGKSGSVWGPPMDMAKSYLKHVYGPDWQTTAHCQDTNHPCGLISNATYDATEALQPSGPLEEPL